jgi:hypothetical protein
LGEWKDDRLEGGNFNDIVWQIKKYKTHFGIGHLLLLFLQDRFLPWEGIAWGVGLYFVEGGHGRILMVRAVLLQ